MTSPVATARLWDMLLALSLATAALAAPAVSWDLVAGDDADPSDVMFDPAFVHQVEITLTSQAADRLWVDPYAYVHGAVSWDGFTFEDVGVRLKGKVGSFRDLNGKAGFKIDLGEWGDLRRLGGQQQITLNNNVQDCAMIKTPVGYQVFELAGSAAPRVSYAWVRVNGTDYGLYTVPESIGDEFLERNYADPSGNLYDGKYAYYGGWNYTLIDFYPTVDDLFQLEEGVDVGLADIFAITDAVQGNAYQPSYYAETGALVDWAEVHPFLAAEQLVGHVDGYAMNENNYRVYFDPTDGLAELIPWDLDNAYIEDWMWGMSWLSPRGDLATFCWTDPACRSAQAAAAITVADAVEAVDWSPEIDRWDQLTRGYVEADPRRECTDDETTRALLHDWMATMPAAVRAMWGG
jgi:hypothetical protein